MLAFTRNIARAAPRLNRAIPAVQRNMTTAPPPRQMADGERVIHEKLTARFAPSQLLVQDVSGGCGTFYAITISSAAFRGLPVVKQHKLVTAELKDEIAGIHGLQVKTVAEE